MRLLLASIIILFASNSIAAPVISGLSGNGTTISISGSGFGSKSQAAPLLRETFDTLTDGDLNGQNGWVRASGAASGSASVVTTSSHTGDKAVYKLTNDEGTTAASMIKPVAPGTKSYVSYWFKYQPVDSTNGGNEGASQLIKQPRLVYDSDGTHYYNGAPVSTMHMGVYFDTRPTILYGDLNNGTSLLYGGWDLNNVPRPAINAGEWHRYEQYIEWASTGGKAKYIVDGNNTEDYVFDRTGLTSLADGHSTPNNFNLLFMTTVTLNTAFGLWYDDIYIDSTPARVELGNAATWETCTHREIQPPTAWSTTAITASFNQGSFTAGQTAYFYVVDADGAVSPASDPYTIGAAPATTTHNSGSPKGRFTIR